MIKVDEIKKLKLEPDELLLVKFSKNRMTPCAYNEYVRKIKEEMTKILPESQVLIYNEDMHFSIVKFKDS